MINVLLADDHGVVREGFTSMLAQATDIQLAGAVASGEEAVRQTRELRPDILLMDVYMPGMGGLEAMRSILKTNRHVKIIGLSAYTGDGYPAMFVRAGAHGFIGKDCSIEELHHAIRKVHAGEQFLPDSLRALAGELADDSTDDPFSELSDRELQTALLLIDGYDVDAIAAILKIGGRTALKYKTRLFEKLGISSVAQLVALAVRHGLVDPQQVKLSQQNDDND